MQTNVSYYFNRKTLIIKVYGKYVENVSGSEDGINLDAIYQGIKISKKEE